MTTRPGQEKNIWIAAGDGDLERVQQLIEGSSMDPNVADPNSYTPMHAAASYDHRPIVTYLISKGGNINITDEDGDTPLYTVESVECARFLIEQCGADPAWKNHEGVTPAMHLEEDFPLVAAYIRTLTSEPAPPPSTMDTADSSFSSIPEDHQPSTETGDEPMMPDADLSANDLNSLMAERLSEEQTNVLMGKFGEIMRQCEEDGINRDEELKRLVEESIFSTVDAGRAMAGGSGSTAPTVAAAAGEGGEDDEEVPGQGDAKRSRRGPDR